MPFGQLVLGAPGAGKSTFCDGMQQFLNATGRRNHIVNLDPANDHPSYEPALDIRALVSLEEVMEAEELGPNGGVLYAVEDLEHNFDWLEEGLRQFGDDYILFDCPGQVELFTHHGSLRNIFMRLQKLGYRLVALHLTDCHSLTRPSLYISALLQALRVMLQMELPHLNVLTKIDTLVNYPKLPFNLDFYTEVQDLEYLLPHLDQEMPGGALTSQPASQDPHGTVTDRDGGDGSKSVGKAEVNGPPSRFRALNAALVEMVDSFGLIGFHPLAVEDKKSMAVLVRAIDRAAGYAFIPPNGNSTSGRSGNGEVDMGARGANAATVWGLAMREQDVLMDVRDVQERWIDRRQEWDEFERKRWEEEGKAAAAMDDGHVAPNQADGHPAERNGTVDDGTPARHSGIKIVRK